jgi:hypothetical protein
LTEPRARIGLIIPSVNSLASRVVVTERRPQCTGIGQCRRPLDRIKILREMQAQARTVDQLRVRIANNRRLNRPPR